MKSESEKAIKVLAGKVTGDVKADDALKYTQAALNLAHVLATLHELERLAANPLSGTR